MRVVGFGASTAQGMRDDEGGGFVARIGRRLEAEGLGTSENFGIGGETTDQMVERARTVVTTPGDQVVVTLGINDVARDPDRIPDRRVPLERHRSNVESILRTFVDAGCRVGYLTQYPVDFAKHGLDPVFVESYIQAGRDAAAAVGVDLIDVHSQIDDALYDQFIFRDGMHFNGEGHEFITQRVWEWLT